MRLVSSHPTDADHPGAVSPISATSAYLSLSFGALYIVCSYLAYTIPIKN
jgi:hypothetical protein